jgi:hypothetical protein
MSTNPSKAILKKAAEEANALKEKAVYYGKEPIGELTAPVKKDLRVSDLESYTTSHQQINQLEKDVSADVLAKAYRASRGIPEPKV